MAKNQSGNIIKDFLIHLHKSYLPNVEEMRKAAKVTGLSLSTVNQAALYGKGSAITHGLLLCYGLKIKPESLGGHLPKLRKTFAGAEKFSILDEQIQKVLRVYSVDEIIVTLELMLAKDKLEKNLGLKKQVGRPKKSP
jgi:hypothetical protein